jgi:hypothetical protein
MPDDARTFDNYTAPKLFTAVEEIKKAQRILECIESHMTTRMAVLAFEKDADHPEATARFNELKDLLRVIQSVR